MLRNGWQPQRRDKNDGTICGTRGDYIPPKLWGVFTLKGKFLYMDILQKPERNVYIFVPEIKDKIVKTFLFSDNKEIKISQQADVTFNFWMIYCLMMLTALFRLN